MSAQSVSRVAATDVRSALAAGEDLMLVCAYEEDEKCRATGIREGIPLSDLRTEEPLLSRNRRIVFY